MELQISGIILCVLSLLGSVLCNGNGTHARKTSRMNSGISAEKKLVKRLLNIYGRIRQNGRPVHNDSSAVPVRFGLGLVQMELNEKDAVLALSMWTKYQWRDDYLQWDPAEYASVTQVNLEKENIWGPDIMLYNTADVAIEQRHALAVVSYKGVVTWYPHSIFRATCSIDIANYPFDDQRCYLAFGSWTHNSREIDLEMAVPGGIDLSTFNNDAQESSSWQILNVTATKDYMPSAEEHPNFAVLTFEIHMRRRVVFSSYILTLPCIFLASLTLVVFMLPPERPDRIGLAMAVFSSFMVLLLILVEAAPPTAASVPRLGVYYCFNMVIIVMAVILSSAIVNISRSKGKPVPKCAQRILLVLSKLLCLNVTSLHCHCPSEHSGDAQSFTPLLCCCLAEDTSTRSSLHAASRLARPQHIGATGAATEPRTSSCGLCDENQRDHNDLMPDPVPLRSTELVPLRSFERAPLCSPEQAPLHSADTAQRCSPDPAPLASSNPVPQCYPGAAATSMAMADPMVDVIRQIRKSLEKKEQEHQESADQEKRQNDVALQWKETAQILDRSLFVIYLVLMTVSLSFLFPKPYSE